MCDTMGCEDQEDNWMIELWLYAQQMFELR